MSQPQFGTVGPFYVRLIDGGGFGAQIKGMMVFPATVNVADPAGLTDNVDAQLSVDAAGRCRVLATPAAGSIFTTQPNAFQSVAARATVATPGAGAAIVTIAAGSLPAGTYDIQATVYFTVVGTVNNAEFRRGAAVISSLQLPAVVSQIPLVHLFRMIMDGATALSINATAADAAGSYSAMLIATRVA